MIKEDLVFSAPADACMFELCIHKMHARLLLRTIEAIPPDVAHEGTGMEAASDSASLSLGAAIISGRLRAHKYLIRCG